MKTTLPDAVAVLLSSLALTDDEVFTIRALILNHRKGEGKFVQPPLNRDDPGFHLHCSKCGQPIAQHVGGRTKVLEDGKPVCNTCDAIASQKTQHGA